MAFPVQKTDEEWRAVLSPGKHPPPLPSPPQQQLTIAEQFRILRQRGTEAPHSGPLDQQASPRRAPTPAPGATRRSTAPRTSSAAAAAGRPSSTPCPGPSCAGATAPSAWSAPRSCARAAAATWATWFQGRGTPDADGRAALRQQREHTVRREGRGGGAKDEAKTDGAEVKGEVAKV